jgi:hypothetical protein
MRVMLLSNGPWPDGDHRMAWALEELRREGEIGAYLVFSHAGEERQFRQEFHNILRSRIDSFKPDIILWDKDSGRDLSSELVKSVAEAATLAYRDLDAWTSVLKPTGPNQQVLCKYAHRVFLCALGTSGSQFRTAGNRVRYTPSAYCNIDVPAPVLTRERRLVFAGSVRRRFQKLLGPFSPHVYPGRQDAVDSLRRRLGDRFIVFGEGYPKRWNIQACSFERMVEVVNNAVASFSIDAAPSGTYFFSNRTPIALACGSIHIRMEKPGDRQFFSECPGVILVNSAPEAVDTFEMVCAWPDALLSDVAQETRLFASRRLRQPAVMRSLLKECCCP